MFTVDKKYSKFILLECSSNFYLKFKNESFTESCFLKWNAFPEQVFQNTQNKHIFLSYCLKLPFQHNNLLFYL